MRITAPGALIAIGLVAFVSPTPAAASCCDHHDKSARCEKHSPPCCKHEGDQSAMSVLLPDLDDQARPAREMLVVWFQRPVKVTDRILFGKYIIEHDNDRQARGEPCTHIYAANNPKVPVVAFHCTHLEHAPADASSVVVRSLGETNGMQALVSFQFAGESGAHGVPANSQTGR